MDQYGYGRLVKIMKQLRAPGGCPWDQKQTYESLCPHIVEEAYELVDAIESNRSMDHLIEECGDLLLQVVFIGTIAEEKGDFRIGDIADQICEKLIRRHPHIFGDVEANDAETVLHNWEKIKMQERARRPQEEDRSILSGVPKGLPATVKAYRIQGKAASVGFDWERGDQGPVLEKIGEELAEVRQAMDRGDPDALSSEIGDLVFAVINLARRMGIDPDGALSKTNEKFSRRFRYIEKAVEKSGKDWDDFSLEELDAFWNQAKQERL